MSCGRWCSVDHLCGVVGLSAVCDCGGHIHLPIRPTNINN